MNGQYCFGGLFCSEGVWLFSAWAASSIFRSNTSRAAPTAPDIRPWLQVRNLTAHMVSLLLY